MIHTITVTVTVDTDKDIQKAKDAIKRGIYRELDAPRFMVAPPKKVDVEFNNGLKTYEEICERQRARISELKKQIKPKQKPTDTKYKYVRLSLMDGFSNSWDKDFPYPISEAEMVEIHKDYGSDMEVLIKYACITDKEFEFTNKMRLR